MHRKTPEQRERFRDFILPMPVPTEFVERIKEESAQAMGLVRVMGVKPPAYQPIRAIYGYA